MRKPIALVAPVALFVLATLTAPAASGQSNVRIGGFLGMEFDTDEDWLIIGAEARLRGSRMQFDVQPRFHYQPFDNGSILQLDVNLLFNFTSAVSQVQPYMGLGGAIHRLSIDEQTPGVDLDETNLGFNLISGLIFGTNPTWRPYAHFEYTIINDFRNGANLSLGILFAVSGRMGTR